MAEDAAEPDDPISATKSGRPLYTTKADDRCTLQQLMAAVMMVVVIVILMVTVMVMVLVMVMVMVMVCFSVTPMAFS